MSEQKGTPDVTTSGTKVAKKSKKKIMIPIIIIAVLLVGIILVGIIISKALKAVSGVAGNMSEVVEVDKRDLSENIMLKGTIAGESKTSITSKAASEITILNVQVGDVVKAGDVLCELDSATIEESLSKANVDVANAKALLNMQTKQNQDALNNARADQATALAAASAAITDAENAYNGCVSTINQNQEALNSMQPTYDELLAKLNQAKAELEATDKNDAELYKEKEEAVKKAQTEFDAYAAQYQKVAAAIAEAQARLPELEKAIGAAKTSYNTEKTSTDRAITACLDTIESSKYQSKDSAADETVKNLMEQLADCKLTAPIDGVVTSVAVSVGDMNTPGATIITIENTNSMKLVVDVAETDILKLNEGMDAVVTTDATDEKEFSGTISRVVRVKSSASAAAPTGDAAAAVSGYLTEISIKNASDLLIGMNAKAKILLKERKDVLCIPYDLVRTDEDGSTYVLIAEKTSDLTATAKRVSVELGEEIDYYVEVTGGELKEGDLLVSNTTIEEGATFTIAQGFQEMMNGASEGEITDGKEEVN